MSSTTTSFNDFQQGSAPILNRTQPFLWSVRRELWEFRSIYVVPLVVAGIFVIGYLIGWPSHAGAAIRKPEGLHDAVSGPFEFVGMFLMAISFIVAIFYCTEALHAERRDRSILFWKSLPISDLTAVLAKISIPMFVIPLIAVVLTIVTNLIMLLLGIVILLGMGQPLGLLWSNVNLGQIWVMMAYHMFLLHGLWMAPVYGWLLLVSAWARRLPFLWAVLPWAAVAALERVVFNASGFLRSLGNVLGGAPGSDAYPGSATAAHSWAHLHLSQAVFSPGLWVGFGFAALCVYGAANLRRRRGPV